MTVANWWKGADLCCLSSYCNHHMVNGKQTDASSSWTDSATVSTECNYTLVSTIELCLSTSLLTGSYTIWPVGGSYINLVLSLQEKVHGRTIAISCGHVYLWYTALSQEMVACEDLNKNFGYVLHWLLYRTCAMVGCVLHWLLYRTCAICNVTIPETKSA